MIFRLGWPTYPGLPGTFLVLVLKPRIPGNPSFLVTLRRLVPLSTT